MQFENASTAELKKLQSEKTPFEIIPIRKVSNIVPKLSPSSPSLTADRFYYSTCIVFHRVSQENMVMLVELVKPPFDEKLERARQIRDSKPVSPQRSGSQNTPSLSFNLNSGVPEEVKQILFQVRIYIITFLSCMYLLAAECCVSETIGISNKEVVLSKYFHSMEKK